MLINTEAPTCPACGGDLVAESHCDLELDEYTYNIVVTQVGKCDCCNTPYNWKEHFAYRGYSNVEKSA